MIIYTNKNEEILIDDEDYFLVKDYTWCKSNKGEGYARSRESRLKHPDYKQKQVTMHRLILGITEPKVQIDHVNGNKLDNRKDNLRICNCSQNQANISVHKRNKVGYKGVRFKAGKYEVNIWKDKSIYLGRYKTLEEAAKVYDKAAVELFGEFARLNFP